MSIFPSGAQKSSGPLNDDLHLSPKCFTDFLSTHVKDGQNDPLELLYNLLLFSH